jgi:hypothetical protein
MCIVYVQQAWSSQQAREVATLERAANRKRNRLVNGYLTARDKLRIVAIYILAAYAAEPAVHFAKQRQQKRLHRFPGDLQTEGEDDSGWLARAEPVYTEAELTQIAAVEMSDRSEEHRLRAEALSWIAKYNAAVYVERQNVALGVAPPTSAVLDAFADAGSSLAEMTARCRRKWIQRFRNNWGLSFGSLPSRQEMPTEEMNAKARAREVREWC